MSTTTTNRMLAPYRQIAAQPVRFLSGFFESPARNFHTSEQIQLDIERSEEDISVVIQDLSTGYRMNSDDLYTSKSFKPPIHKESTAINSFDLIQRMPGQNPFEAPDFRANVITRMLRGMGKIEDKIRRSIELQAAQILQTGVLTLSDYSGNPLYSLDFSPKASHFPTAGTSWASATGLQKIADLQTLSNQIRSDGLTSPDQLIMGDAAFENFISDAEVQKRFDIRNINLGSIARRNVRGNGGIYMGIVEIGTYKYDVWTYDGRYKDPATGVSTQYVTPGKIIVRASTARMDATFGAIPNIGALMGSNGASLIPELPGRISDADGSMDLFTNIWMSQDGEQLFGGVGARPLLIPTAIDTYGCLDTQL